MPFQRIWWFVMLTKFDGHASTPRATTASVTAASTMIVSSRRGWRVTIPILDTEVPPWWLVSQVMPVARGSPALRWQFATWHWTKCTSFLAGLLLPAPVRPGGGRTAPAARAAGTAHAGVRLSPERTRLSERGWFKSRGTGYR